MITDQPFWASRITELGAGPKTVPYKQLSAGSLGAAISDAVNRDSYRTRTKEVAKNLASEDGALPVIRALDRLTATA
jgi:sterol 3beta-glucosyltransferase